MPKKKSKTHVKPTVEELEAKTQEAIKEAEELENEPIEEETPDENPEVDAPSNEEGEDEGEVSPEDEGEAEPSEEVKERLKKEVEEKDKKLSASARENQKIYAKNRVINKALMEAEEAPEPTEEDLIAEYQDWDMMSEVEKRFAKETVISRNWRQTIAKAKEQATKIEKWNDSVDEFVGDPQTLIDNPELEGKQENFTEFAKQEAHNSVPFNVLVGAFLHEQSKGKKSNKGKMFETGSGGPNEKPQPKGDTITLEEARKLRETDYPKYKEYLKAGKIKSDL